MPRSYHITFRTHTVRAMFKNVPRNRSRARLVQHQPAEDNVVALFEKNRSFDPSILSAIIVTSLSAVRTHRRRPTEIREKRFFDVRRDEIGGTYDLRTS